MPNKTGFIIKQKPMTNKSQFESRWGEPAWKIAERENVSTTTIHMRVRNYGNPYQRKAKPSHWEAKYGMFEFNFTGCRWPLAKKSYLSSSKWQSASEKVTNHAQ